MTPSSSSGAKATVDLVDHLREDVIPAAEAGGGPRVHLGGETATNIDVAHALMSRLPLYLVLVASLGILLLAVAFRGLLVDAFVVRMVLVPALPRMIGGSVWAYPRWAERVIPRLAVDGPAARKASEPVGVLAAVGSGGGGAGPVMTEEP